FTSTTLGPGFRRGDVGHQDDGMSKFLRYVLDHFQVETRNRVLGRITQQAHLADADVAQDLRPGADRQVAALRCRQRTFTVALFIELLELFRYFAAAAFVGQYYHNAFSFLCDARHRLVQRPRRTFWIRNAEQVAQG